MARYDLCEKSFSEVHRTGMRRDEYELIVVNNGGIHDKLIENLDADVVITNSKNIGQAMAWNEGVVIARCKNLALMDDDLGYKDGWLQYGLDLLYQFPKHVISLRHMQKKYKTGDAGQGHTFARKVGGVWIMRRGWFDRIGRFGNVYGFGGHWTRNLIRSGSRFVVSKEPYIFHLGGKASMRKLANERHHPRTA